MKHFKDSQGNVHGFEADGSQDFLIAAAMVALTGEELELLFNPPAPVVDSNELILAEIKANEREYMLPRVTREFMLLTMEAQFTPEQLARGKGYVALKAFDDAIASLRGKLK